MEKKDNLGRIVVICGPPLSGKTTLARLVAIQTGGQLVDVDDQRFRLLPDSAGLFDQNPIGERQLMVAAYEIAVAKCRFESAVMRRLVVVSGPFSARVFKRAMEGLIEDKIVPVQIFRLDAPEDEIRRRIQERIDSGAQATIKTWEKYQWALSIRKPWRPEIRDQVKRITTTADTTESLQAILAEIETGT